MIRILIADDHAIVRGGLKQILATTADMVVTAEAGQGSEVIEKLRTCEVDLLLLDMTMPGISGVDLIRRVRAEEPALPVLVLSIHNEAQVASRALRLVSYGYIFYAWGMVTSQAFNGAGDTYTPTMIAIATNWILQMPVAWVLAFKTGLGPDGVFLTIAVSASIYAVVAVVLFRRGGWKRQRV